MLCLLLANGLLHICILCQNFYGIPYFSTIVSDSVGPVAQSVKRSATGWTVRGSNPGGGESFRTCPDRPWGPPSLLYNGYRVFPGVKERPGRDVDPSPLSSAVVKKELTIPLLPLWAVRPVQSLSACTRVTFTFFNLILDSALRSRVYSYFESAKVSLITIGVGFRF